MKTLLYFRSRLIAMVIHKYHLSGVGASAIRTIFRASICIKCFWGIGLIISVTCRKRIVRLSDTKIFLNSINGRITVLIFTLVLYALCCCSETGYFDVFDVIHAKTSSRLNAVKLSLNNIRR